MELIAKERDAVDQLRKLVAAARHTTGNEGFVVMRLVWPLLCEADAMFSKPKPETP